MPEITFRYKPELAEKYKKEDLMLLAKTIRPLVAEAMTTESYPLTVDDIEFIPEPYPEFTVGTEPVSFEIRAFGFTARKNALSKKVTRNLKQDILECLNSIHRRLFLPKIDEKKLLLWVQFFEGTYI